MNVKLSELKLNKVRKILEYEVDGDKKQITIYNAIGKKRENLLNMLKVGNQLTDKGKAADMLYKSILKELVDLDVDVKNTLPLAKAPNIILLQINHEIDEIIYELQYEFISSQMRLLNQAKISAMTAYSLNRMNEMTEDIEGLKNANV